MVQAYTHSWVYLADAAHLGTTGQDGAVAKNQFDTNHVKQNPLSIGFGLKVFEAKVLPLVQYTITPLS